MIIRISQVTCISAPGWYCCVCPATMPRWSIDHTCLLNGGHYIYHGMHFKIYQVCNKSWEQGKPKRSQTKDVTSSTFCEKKFSLLYVPGIMHVCDLHCQSLLSASGVKLISFLIFPFLLLGLYSISAQNGYGCLLYTSDAADE